MDMPWCSYPPLVVIWLPRTFQGANGQLCSLLWQRDLVFVELQSSIVSVHPIRSRVGMLQLPSISGSFYRTQEVHLYHHAWFLEQHPPLSRPYGSRPAALSKTWLFQHTLGKNNLWTCWSECILSFSASRPGNCFTVLLLLCQLMLTLFIICFELLVNLITLWNKIIFLKNQSAKFWFRLTKLIFLEGQMDFKDSHGIHLSF